MSVFEIWLIGLALAIDCFTVSIATGIATRRVLWRPMFFMSLMFGVFQGGMLLLGYVCTSALNHYIQDFDHWIAFVLLFWLGTQMIVSDIKGDSNDGAKTLSALGILTMSVATSIDALAVGVSMACVGTVVQFGVLIPAFIVAFCSWALAIVGLGVGIQLGKHIRWHISTVGGIVLILIGIKILFEHLG
ncbi:MAG: manganese efflux pump [Bacteroidaceae bacterium]|nr:manganese efflux pump [Bacteroidaceae bacterium]